jgi:hypothetical protein
LENGRNITLEKLFLKDSPFWTFLSGNTDGLIVRNTKIEARITNLQTHTLLDLTAFNTDGIDVTGKNVYIHDTDIWVQDDCISVKDGARDMFFERISCSGVGLVIGSIGSSVVRFNFFTFDKHLAYFYFLFLSPNILF